MMDELKELVRNIDDRVKDLESLAKDRYSAPFPAGDHDGHRRWHEAQIELLEERRKLRRAIQEKTISGLVWAGVVGTGLLLWDGLKHYLLRLSP